MPPIEVIDLLSSSPAHINPPRRKAPSPTPELPSDPRPPILASTKAPPPKFKQRLTVNNVPLRSSPRRRAAAAALERFERAKIESGSGLGAQNEKTVVGIPNKMLDYEDGFRDLSSSLELPNVGSTGKRLASSEMGKVPTNVEKEHGCVETTLPAVLRSSWAPEAHDKFVSLKDELVLPVEKRGKQPLQSDTFLELSDNDVAAQTIASAIRQPVVMDEPLQYGRLPDFSDDLDTSCFNVKPHPRERSSPPLSGPVASKGDDGFFFLSDDDDEAAGRARLPELLCCELATHQENFINLSDDLDKSKVDAGYKPTTETEIPAKIPTAVCKGGDFSFLSDDFDSNLDIDQSFTGTFAAARRRTPSSHLYDVPTEKKRKVSETVDIRSIDGKAAGSFKRATSDVSTFSKKRGRDSLRRSITSVSEADPILFTSSPDEVRLTRERRERAKKQQDKKNDHISDVESFVKPVLRDPQGLAWPSDDELPDIGSISSYKLTTIQRQDSTAALEVYKASKGIDVTARQKAQEKSNKAVAKEEEKERKRIEKEAKARDKQAAAEVAKVNTLKTDKKTSTPEMIVDLSNGLDAKLTNQLKVFFSPLGVQLVESGLDTGMKNVIKWRRKVEAAYNEELGHWEPVPKRIRSENHVMCIMQAKEFVELATGDEGADLDSHVLRMKSIFRDCEIIYLLEGITQWMRKNKNVKNRAFAEAVRSQIPAEPPAALKSAQGRKKKAGKVQEYVDEDMIEDTLLRLQVMHGAFIHHTGAVVETAQWVVAFTQHISTIPYRQQRMTMDTAFCMESGQVKTGENPEDTFVKMLQEVNRITPSIAYGIAAEYPSVTKLVKAFEGRGSSGKDILQNLKKSTNKDGAFSDKNIGPKISRRVYGIFMGTEEGSTDV